MRTERERRRIRGVNHWQATLAILGMVSASIATPDGIAALLRPPMAKADQFGLWPQSAATPDALLSIQIKRCLPFSNSNPQFKPTDIVMSSIARNRMKNWEIVADNLSKAGWSVGCIVSMDPERRDIFVVVARRDGNRYVVRADEKLTAFLELESAIGACDKLY
jgi:hypothetical protein